MFSHISTVVFYLLSTLTILAAATPWNTPTTSATVTTTITVTAPATTQTIPASSCSTGDLQCCDTIESANSGAASLLLGLLGVVLTDVDVLLGISCSPIQIIGLGNSGCSAQAVCCEDNAVGGLISIGCIAVEL